MITISTMAATARQTFAFARDDGLPFSRWLAYVSSSIVVPTLNKLDAINLPIARDRSTQAGTYL